MHRELWHAPQDQQYAFASSSCCISVGVDATDLDEVIWMSNWWRICKTYMEKAHKSAVKDLKLTKTIVRGGLVQVSGTVSVLPPSQLGQLITHDPKKLHRNRNLGWHQEFKGVVSS